MTTTAVPDAVPRAAPAAALGRVARRRRRGGSAGPSRTATAAMFLTPFLVVYLAFVVYPVFSAARMSLYDWDLLGFTREFIGLENYRRMLWGTGMTWDATSMALLRLPVLALTGWFAVRALREGQRWLRVLPGVLAGLLLYAVLGIHPGADGAWNDPGFWISVEHTLEFTFISTPILVGLGLAMAMALAGKHRGGAVYRAAFFLPYVLPVSAVTLVWSFLLNPDRGLVARALGWVGIEPITWLGNPDLAMWGIVMTTVWWSVGFNLVLFLAGLQDIDPHLYEAAKLDGAGAWNRFRHVTVPGLSQIIVLVLVTQLIASFQVFGQVYIMTRGGPGTSTRVLIQHIYESGFRDLQLGYAAAVSLFLFVVMALVSAVQFRISNRTAA
jgi:multiple sugar transport system permease protein